MKIFILFFAVYILMNLSNAEAKYTQNCVVKYKTENGWSKNYSIEVIFISGYELNEATNSYKYSGYSIYAVIFWGEDQTSLIKLSSVLSCGLTVDKNCIKGPFADLKGKDQGDIEWNICVGELCY